MSEMFVYMTAGSLEEARRIGRALVEERLVACVNLLPITRSIYRWQDRVEEAEEVAMIAKTQAPLVDRLTRRVAMLHSYDCPCVVALPIAGGNPEYLAWIAAETGPDDDGTGMPPKSVKKS